MSIHITHRSTADTKITAATPNMAAMGVVAVDMVEEVEVADMEEATLIPYLQ